MAFVTIAFLFIVFPPPPPAPPHFLLFSLLLLLLFFCFLLHISIVFFPPPPRCHDCGAITHKNAKTLETEFYSPSKEENEGED